MLDWEADLGALAERLGVGQPNPAANSPSEAALAGPWALPFGLVEAAQKETARRGASYAARWSVMRPGASGQLGYYVERALIWQIGDGLWLEHHASGHVLSGGVLVLGNRLYAMTADSSDDSFNFYLLSGIAGPRALFLDGIMMSAGCGVHDDPFAMPMVFTRAGELENEARDDEWARGGSPIGKVVATDLPPKVRAVFERDFGPTAAATGGDAILRIRR